MQSSFGAGFLFGTPAGGAPVMFGALQDVSMDVSFDQKMLYGQGSFALEMARGKGKIDFKATVGRIDPVLFNNIFWGQAASTGQILTALGEAVTVSGTSYTATNATTFRTDLGAFDTGSGRFLTRVTSSPAAGQYAVNAATGVYTWATADAGAVRKLYYTYGSASAGTTISVTNPVMDAGPVFVADLAQTFRGKQSYIRASACQSFKLSMPLKQDDFTLPAIDFSAMDDGTGSVLTQSAMGS